MGNSSESETLKLTSNSHEEPAGHLTSCKDLRTRMDWRTGCLVVLILVLALLFLLSGILGGDTRENAERIVKLEAEQRESTERIRKLEAEQQKNAERIRMLEADAERIKKLEAEQQKMQQEIAVLAKSQSGTWTPLGAAVPVTFDASQTQKFDLVQLGVPAEAQRVLLYVYCGMTSCTSTAASGTFTFWSQEVNPASFVVMSNAPTNPTWTYNSDNFWVPLGVDRNLYVKFATGIPFVPGNCGIVVDILGWS